jgi:hypothetical protein
MVQFRVSRLFGLRVDADGMLIPGERGLQLVFHQPVEQQSLLDAKVQVIEIPWADLEDWHVDYGLLGDRVVLTVSSVDCLQTLPGVKDRSVELTIRKQQRSSLKEFEQRAKDYQTGQRADTTDQTIDEIRDFLQGH